MIRALAFKIGALGKDSDDRVYGKVDPTSKNVVQLVRIGEGRHLHRFISAQFAPNRTYTLPRRASSFATQRTPCRVARADIARTMKLVKSVCELFNSRRAPMVADFEVHHGFEDGLGP